MFSFPTPNLPHLHLISSGYFPPNPAELLSGKRFPAMITTLREQADYIFIDVPPAAAVADSSIVTSLCDGCILVLESGRIRRRFAQDVVEQLKKTDTPLLGTILNKVKLRRNDPYYNRYYKYGYGYGYGYGRKNASSEKKKRRWFSR